MLAVTYLVLMRAFRSLLLPLKAVVLNLLSVGATYGLLVVTFRWGLGGIIGLPQANQIEAWIPMFLFAMLFGLSMDYEVFLLSRMRELYDQTGDTERAVAHGLMRTGRIVTAAAAIMVAAFSGFMLGSLIGLVQFGFGLAAAITIDATIIRALLVPALMKLMGEWNWYLPPWLARLLRVDARRREPARLPRCRRSAWTAGPRRRMIAPCARGVATRAPTNPSSRSTRRSPFAPHI